MAQPQTATLDGLFTGTPAAAPTFSLTRSAGVVSPAPERGRRTLAAAGGPGAFPLPAAVVPLVPVRAPGGAGIVPFFHPLGTRSRTAAALKSS
ncbi:hypothetical protein [Streptomyces peucetius]|uniref:Uncharacterized protein n=1 Tax=Streptomyces peucetius TaxID=1950 RepID=A0ABY6IHA8_STRPE|nr:hypothetical protein [Streptomyces peucetius]UYQ65302.1 hypothetical protein OGH68_30120 [Streptomyces peucetius]